MEPPSLHRLARPAGCFVAIFLCAVATAAAPPPKPALAPTGAPSAVRGTVVVKGVKSNADAVVTLEAPGLKLGPPPGSPSRSTRRASASSRT